MTTKQTSEPQSAPVALIGAGPIGIELAVGLKRAGVDVLHFEARQINGRHPPHKTDFVLLNTGFHGDQTLLKMAGVTLRDEYRIPVFDPETMQTDVPGLYLAGTVAAGVQQRYSLFIENCHEHTSKIVRAITGQEAVVGGVAGRNYEPTRGRNVIMDSK